MAPPAYKRGRFDFCVVVVLFCSSALLLAVFGCRRPHPKPISCRDARAILVGDVHGCRRELQILLRRVQFNAFCDSLYFLGDVIGKGPNSIEALRDVRSLMLASTGVHSLMGNHEAGFLRWLDARAAGTPLPPTSNELDRKKWAAALSLDEIAWLRKRPLQLALPSQFGRVLAVHAGMRPGVPPTLQTRDDLLTIRSLLPNGTGSALPGRPGPRGGWAAAWKGPEHLIFGHDARRKLQRHPFATGLDSGVVYGGRLTALVLQIRNATSAAPSMLYGGHLLQVGAHPASCARKTQAPAGRTGKSRGNSQAATKGSGSGSRHGLRGRARKEAKRQRASFGMVEED